MTDNERLAIAEEIICAAMPRETITLDDVRLWKMTEDVKWSATKTGDTRILASSDFAIDCVIAARQKLAAEREASRTPEERRLREVLKDIADRGNSLYTAYDCANIARKALEQGA